jgi:hypothetical protein
MDKNIPRTNWRAIWSYTGPLVEGKPRYQEKDLGPKRPTIAVIRALRAETPPEGYEWLGARNDNTWEY